MEQITINPNNEPYYSEDFIKGFKCGAERQFEADKADRPQGEWIFDPEILCSDIGVYSAGYRCSVCGKDYFKVEGMNYCPNCGADMREQTMTTHDLAVALAKQLEEEGVTYEELERIIHDAKEEARKEIARMKGADDADE